MAEDETTDSPAPAPEEVDRTPEEALSNKLAEQADTVTAGLRDLLPDSKPAGSDEIWPDEGAAGTVALFGSSKTSVEAAAPEEPVVAAGETAEAPTAVAPAAQANPGPAASFVAAEAPGESSSDDRLMSALAWLTLVLLQLPIVSVIQLLATTTKDRPFQRHHAITSLLFFAVAVVYELVAGIVYATLGALTLGCGYACLWVIFFLPHALGLYYALQAYNGKTIELPVLSNFARRQGWL